MFKEVGLICCLWSSSIFLPFPVSFILLIYFMFFLPICIWIIGCFTGIANFVIKPLMEKLL